MATTSSARQRAAAADQADKPAPRAPRRSRRARGDWRPRFLAAFVEVGTVVGACRKIGMGARTVYDERQRSEEFALLFADAEEAVTQSLEQEAVRRALDGSDRLMEFILKARRPERYSDQQRLVHSGTVGVTPVLNPDQIEEELQAFGMPAALAIEAGPEAVLPPVEPE